HTRVSQMKAEGFELLGPAERVLEAYVFERDQRAAMWKAVRQARKWGDEAGAKAAARAAWGGPAEAHLHRIGEGGGRAGEQGPRAQRPEDAGVWHLSPWWD